MMDFSEWWDNCQERMERDNVYPDTDSLVKAAWDAGQSSNPGPQLEKLHVQLHVQPMDLVVLEAMDYSFLQQLADILSNKFKVEGEVLPTRWKGALVLLHTDESPTTLPLFRRMAELYQRHEKEHKCAICQTFWHQLMEMVESIGSPDNPS